jgi:hypothetical protein
LGVVEEDMNMFVRLSLVTLCVLFASHPSPALARDLVARGLDAMGGEAAVGQLRTIAVRGQDSQWEHESSYEPGPKAKSRPAGEAKFVIQRDLVSGNARIDWDRTVVRTCPRPVVPHPSRPIARETE